ncbi:hypothetical protein XENOCAPTIV_027108 [Xenoophorus captivus]|uniref:Uncharacterized protein n=1 Tax=Xenoophorus captivus TaxID=1517983 RepID=A0ABV0RJ02_9TELE
MFSDKADNCPTFQQGALPRTSELQRAIEALSAPRLSDQPSSHSNLAVVRQQEAEQTGASQCRELHPPPPLHHILTSSSLMFAHKMLVLMNLDVVCFCVF